MRLRDDRPLARRPLRRVRIVTGSYSVSVRLPLDVLLPLGGEENARLDFSSYTKNRSCRAGGCGVTGTTDEPVASPPPDPAYDFSPIERGKILADLSPSSRGLEGEEKRRAYAAWHDCRARGALERQAVRSASSRLLFGVYYELGPASKLTLSTSSEACLRNCAIALSESVSAFKAPQAATSGETGIPGLTGYSKFASA